MRTFKNKSVAVLGLSIEGLDSVQFFRAQGAKICCSDRRTRQELGETYTKLASVADEFQLGEAYLANLERFDVVVRTPGMSLRLPELAALTKSGKEITSATKLFFELSAAPIIGVTGTKGKGTTSTLIARTLSAAGRKVWLGGNVGVPLLSKIPDIQKSDIVVLELSSFQLEDLTKSPRVAVVLRTTQEHLVNQDTLASNFHPDREAYVDAKKSIVRYQNAGDTAVLNADDPTSSSFARETKGHALYFSRTDYSSAAFVRDHTVYLREGGKEQKIATLAGIKLRGEHNLDNIAAAALALQAAGVPVDVIARSAAAFEGLEHRLETVATVGGVLYVNDSFSTVPETAIAAIESFTEPIILIAGGSEKGSDFTQLGQSIAKGNVKALIAIGKMTTRIVQAARAAGYKGAVVTGLRSMPEIITSAAKIAASGDVVLLSPAAASFDMFKNYKERGYQFKHEVSLLASG
ncbi:UDP-N-acetylmuramoylalanine--D-glutamate ligase [Candidatus Gottesmanbacteria bacterium RIFOXYB1_FULL_47_11]|uniref:UDP-N-acetylmuramoylalanine--D-glutamate ligase n=1 Tax=Candidatus Gottesmanbacteria bacterium RIFOXYB1_FULL_47_11 TaxID=1798401 RepID=A0A1F6BC42_9BACT|nr:MAG: UDP-N-acetylmuramoylalanine--D-glutamate ligase [Candidatus Gottesmanbacteria bacterium RIFOXYB1_FULL_47_11]